MRNTLSLFWSVCVLASIVACDLLGPSGPTPLPALPPETPLPALPDLTGQWQLKVSYKNSGSDKAWDYSESLESITPFQVTSDDQLSGKGTGTYTPGAKLQSPIFSCDKHPPLPITTTLTGQVKPGPSKGEVFSIHLVVNYSQALQPSGSCTASGVASLVIPMEATVAVLNQRTAAALTTDFLLPTISGGFIIVPVPGEMIAWTIKGDGQAILSVTRIK